MAGLQGISLLAWWEDRGRNIAPSWQGKGKAAWTRLWRVDSSGSAFLSGLSWMHLIWGLKTAVVLWLLVPWLDEAEISPSPCPQGCFLTMTVSWYQSLIKVLLSRFPQSCRHFHNAETGTQYLVSPSPSPTCRLSPLSRAPACCAFSQCEPGMCCQDNVGTVMMLLSTLQHEVVCSCGTAVSVCLPPGRQVTLHTHSLMPRIAPWFGSVTCEPGRPPPGVDRVALSCHSSCTSACSWVGVVRTPVLGFVLSPLQCVLWLS